MPKSSKRIRQVADLVKREIAVLMKTSISDPRLAGVMITSVDISPDLSNAKVYFILSDSSAVEEANKALQKATSFIRHALAQKTELRYTPQLSFLYDESISHANKLLSLIDKAESEKTNPETETDSDA